MRLYDRQDLREQIAFIAYYFHWSYAEIVSFSHIERNVYCEEIMRIHQKEKGDQISLSEIR